MFAEYLKLNVTSAVLRQSPASVGIFECFSTCTKPEICNSQHHQFPDLSGILKIIFFFFGLLSSLSNCSENKKPEGFFA
ncbi:MAG: hypothetical protein C0433_06250 [Cyclobacterium sp.]|nr:hypothetical protein [Cyclobacterium sp.]